LIARKGGKIVKYDGATTWSDYSSALATALGGTYDINTLEWNGTTWLVGGGGKIASSTDGQSFTNKSASVTMSAVYKIKWNGSYWLIGGANGSATVLYTSADLNTFNLQANPSYFASGPIWAIESNNSGLNLIGGQNGKFYSRTGTATSPSNTDLSKSIKDFGKENIRASEWNGSYWLIVGNKGCINKYDGAVFTDLKSALGFGDSNVLSVRWNGSYWLIGGADGKLAYSSDGATFTLRTTQLAFGGYSVNAIEWANSMWYIGGDNNYLKTSTDGTNFTDRSSVLTAGGWTSGSAVNTITYRGPSNGDVMIGGASGNIGYYNGVTTYASLRVEFFSTMGVYHNINR
ncbi:MAG TPA: hypothetical protein PKJ42_10455, partial [Candidatus Goldiibacteriota bacterium]|nr:hypothetical protein [Candidatus Goldiibacteriota bacterium]